MMLSQQLPGKAMTLQRPRSVASAGLQRRGTAPLVCASASNMLAAVDQAPPDLVLGITEAFKADPSPDKLNLGVGAYRTEEVQPYVLPVVTKAEERMLAAKENKEYLPIEGLASFRKATGELLLGPNSPALAAGRVATLQALSGTGSLTIGAQFIAQFMPGAAVFISNPTWPNHKNIFALAGVEWKNYRYFDPESVGLDFEGMIADINAAPAGSVILLHGCAHNPTGIDPTKEQWAAIADVVESKGHFAFFDVAYQGFATGSLDEDAYAPRYFESRGMDFMVAQSYSKNLGLYGERVGALNVVAADSDTAGRVLSQLKRIARAIWSSPPTHGARIVAEVVGDEALFNEWRGEMQGMSGRIKTVRQVLYDALVKLNPDKNWNFVVDQIGMFTFTGCSPRQVENMTAKWHIYMTKDGRISLAGLSQAKCEYVARALDDSVRNH